MAFVIADRVRETTTTTGTGAVTLAGAYISFQTFSAAIGNGNQTYYTIASAATGEWEVGIGTYTAVGNTLTRNTILASSNAGAAVNFTSGSKDVFVTQPSERALLLNTTSNGLVAGNAAFTTGDIPYANSTTTLTNLAIGAANRVLTSSGTAPQWVTSLTGLTGVSSSSITNTSLTSGRVVYSTTGGAETDSANLTFDGTTLTAANITSGGTWTFSGGTANGVVYLNGSKVATSGSALVFDGTNLGIGTSSPSQKLSVLVGDASQAASFQAATGRARVRPYVDATSGAIIDATNAAENAYTPLTLQGSSLRLLGNSGSGAVVDSSGRVGIGTSSPASNLQVSFTSTQNSFPSSVATASIVVLNTDTTTNNFQGVAFRNAASVSVAAIAAINTDQTLSYADISIANKGAAGLTEKIRILADGNVGIGTSSPSSKLTVAGGAVNLTSNSSNHNIYQGTGWIWTSDGTSSGTTRAGIYGNSNGTLSLFGGSTISSQVTLDSSGNLGIGTTSPGYKLSVAGASGSAVLNLLETGVRSWGVRAGGTATNTFDIADFTAGATRLTIDSSGNLGIGTSSPAVKLDVAGASTTQARIQMSGQADVRVISDTGTGIIGTYSNHPLSIKTNSTDVIVATAAGNVGIGTSSPGSKLQVSGIVSSIGSGTSIFAAGETGTYTLSGITSPNYGIAYGTLTGKSNPALTVSGFDAIAFGTNQTERMRLDSSGNLGLGVTPSAWSSFTGFQFGAVGALASADFGGSNVQTFFGNNIYYGGSPVSFRAIKTNVSTIYRQVGKTHVWGYSESVTANNAITITEAMTLDASGYLGIGTTSPAGPLDAVESVNSISYFGVRNSNAGTSAFTRFRVGNSGSANAFTIDVFGTGHSTKSNVVEITNQFNAALTLGTNGTERARIDSSGRLLLAGTTAYSNSKLQLVNGDTNVASGGLSQITFQYSAGGYSHYLTSRHDGAGTSDGNAVYLYLNNSTTAGGSSAPGTGNLLSYIATNNTHSWYTGGSERARITSGGYFGIGTTNPIGPLQVKTSGGQWRIENYSTGTKMVSVNAADTAEDFLTLQGTPIVFLPAGQERARITSGGDLLVGTTSQLYGERFNVTNGGVGKNCSTLYFNSSDDRAVEIIRHARASGATQASMIAFLDSAGTERGSIKTDGSATAYNTSSDRRLKENIVSSNDAGAVIDSIEIVQHDWKSGGHVRYGVIAQDLHKVAPEAVSAGDDGEEIEKTWGVDYSKLVPMLIKEVQSLRKRVAELEAK